MSTFARVLASIATGAALVLVTKIARHLIAGTPSLTEA